jgi:hypothetical protein
MKALTISTIALVGIVALASVQADEPMAPAGSSVEDRLEAIEERLNRLENADGAAPPSLQVQISRANERINELERKLRLLEGAGGAVGNAKVEVPPEDRDRQAVPVGSEWVGTLKGRNEQNQPFETIADAVVLESSEKQIKIRVKDPNVVWEYSLSRGDRGWTISSAELTRAPNPQQGLGKYPIADSSVTISAKRIVISGSRPGNAGQARQFTWTLNRSE